MSEEDITEDGDQATTTPESEMPVLRSERTDHFVPRLLKSRELYASLVVVVGGTVVTAFTLAHVSALWVIAGTLVLSGCAVAAAHATRADIAPGTTVLCLWTCVVLLVVFIAGTAAYHRWWEPATGVERAWEFVLRTNDETQVLHPSGEPGGPPLLLGPGNTVLQPLAGGNTILVSCGTVLDDGSRWLRLAGTVYWIPDAAVRPRAGSSGDDLPDCPNSVSVGG